MKRLTEKLIKSDDFIGVYFKQYKKFKNYESSLDSLKQLTLVFEKEHKTKYNYLLKKLQKENNTNYDNLYYYLNGLLWIGNQQNYANYDNRKVINNLRKKYIFGGK